jgi:pimeloyl-ACP methyl ester carboxylesterase
MPPHVVGLFHGILTGKSDGTWPRDFTRFFAELFPQVLTVESEYFALPLPRIEALRNRGRSRELRADIVDLIAAACQEFQAPPVSIVSHSNGAVLALQVARSLIEAGIPVRSMVLIAPALRTGPATREIAEWIERGMLDYALLVRPTRDKLIGAIGANWRTRLYAWPWGSLGHDGWSMDDAGEVFPCALESIDLPNMRHSDPVSLVNRRFLFSEIIAPALGLAPWGTFKPGGPDA